MQLMGRCRQRPIHPDRALVLGLDLHELALLAVQEMAGNPRQPSDCGRQFQSPDVVRDRVFEPLHPGKLSRWKRARPPLQRAWGAKASMQGRPQPPVLPIGYFHEMPDFLPVCSSCPWWLRVCATMSSAEVGCDCVAAVLRLRCGCQIPMRFPVQCGFRPEIESLLFWRLSGKSPTPLTLLSSATHQPVFRILHNLSRRSPVSHNPPRPFGRPRYWSDGRLASPRTLRRRADLHSGFDYSWHPNRRLDHHIAQGPISGASDLERLRARIPIPPPDMFFGENSLTLSHDASAVSIVFNAEDALECVGRKQDELEGLVKVAHAETWNRSKGDIDKMAKPYDWTFSTDYKGSVGISAPFDDTSVGIDMDVLKRQDEILFYEEMSLYEDELADNGASVLNLRIRVMPTFFFVLMRLFVRVDGVLFRVRDTRLFHQFEESFVIRDYREMEQDYASVKSCIPKLPPWHPMANIEDVSLLTDPNWVTEVLSRGGSNANSGESRSKKVLQLLQSLRL